MLILVGSNLSYYSFLRWEAEPQKYRSQAPPGNEVGNELGNEVRAILTWVDRKVNSPSPLTDKGLGCEV
jgi:hypothetical protein